MESAFAPESHRPRKRKILGAGQALGHQGGALRVGPRDQHIGGIFQQLFRDGHHLFRRLPLSENHFGHAVPQRAMVIHLGESQVFERHVAHASHGSFNVDRAAAHLFEQRPELLLIHEARISERRLRPSHTGIT